MRIDMLQLVATLSFLLLAALGGSAPLIVCPANLAAGQTYYCFLSVTNQTTAPPSLELRQTTGSSAALASALPDAQNPGLYGLALKLQQITISRTSDLENQQNENCDNHKSTVSICFS